MSMLSLTPGVLFKEVGFNRTSTPVGAKATPNEIRNAFKRESFHEDIDWPPDSPVAKVYDVQNTPASMVILNNKQQYKRLRGYENHQPSPPDPVRHSDTTKKNEGRHSTCLDSSSPSFEPKPKIKPMWMNQNLRPPWTPVENNFTNPRRHMSCRISSDPGTLSLELSKRKKSAGVQRQDKKPAISMRDNAALVHPDLSESNKRYMYFISKTYDMTNMKQQKQLQYRDLLMRQQYLGYHSDEEYRKYMKYIEGPRKRQFGGGGPLFQSGHRSRPQSSVGTQSVKSSETYDTESAPYSSRSSYNSSRETRGSSTRPKTAPPLKRQRPKPQSDDHHSEKQSPRNYRDYSPRSKKDVTREHMRKLAKEKKESKSPRPQEEKNDGKKDDDHSDAESKKSSHSSGKSSLSSRKSSLSSRKSSLSSSNESLHSKKDTEKDKEKVTDNKHRDTTDNKDEEQQSSKDTGKDDERQNEVDNKTEKVDNKDEIKGNDKAVDDKEREPVHPPTDEPTERQETIVTEKERQIFDMDDKSGNKANPTDADNGNIMDNQQADKQLRHSSSSSSISSSKEVTNNQKKDEQTKSEDTTQQKQDNNTKDKEDNSDPKQVSVDQDKAEKGAPKIVISDPSNKEKSYDASESEMSFEIRQKTKDDIDDDMKMNANDSDIESTGRGSVVHPIEDNEQKQGDSDNDSVALSECLPGPASYRGKYSPRPSESDAGSITDRGEQDEQAKQQQKVSSDNEPSKEDTKEQNPEDNTSICSSVILPEAAEYKGKYSPRIQSDASDNDESQGVHKTEPANATDSQPESTQRKMPSREELKDGKLVLYFKKPSVDQSEGNDTHSPAIDEKPATEITKETTDSDSIKDDHAAHNAGSNQDITAPQTNTDNNSQNASLEQQTLVQETGTTNKDEIQNSQDNQVKDDKEMNSTEPSVFANESVPQDTDNDRVKTIYKDSESDSSSSSDEEKQNLGKTLQDDVMKQLAAYEEVMDKSEESDVDNVPISTEKEDEKKDNVKPEKSNVDERDQLALSEELTLQNDSTMEIHKGTDTPESNKNDSFKSDEQDKLPLNEEITLRNDDALEIPKEDAAQQKSSTSDPPTVEKTEDEDKDGNKTLTDTFPTEMFEKLPEQNEVVLDNQNTMEPSSRNEENAVLSDDGGESLTVSEEQTKQQQSKQGDKEGSKSSLSSSSLDELNRSSHREGVDRPKTRLGNRPTNGDAPQKQHVHSSTSSMSSEEDMATLSASFYREGVDRPKSRGGRRLPETENDKADEESEEELVRNRLRRSGLM